ncbi:MAG: FAS1-like dehydratase domain-containing protein [Chloroflexota bacterium]|uniref:FAS1-like dehydratase domain-containing protein n=1 Tax=Actinophytocola sp. TaxID=1872138 RepID=UPI003D6BA51B
MSDDANPEYGKITDEAVARLTSRMGKRFPIQQPYVRYVNQDSIAHVARSIGDDNPLYIDPKYATTTRYGRLVAPPAIYYAAAWGSWDLRRGQGLPGVHGLHSGDEWRYFRPLYEGDELHATKELVRAEPMEGRLAGKKMYIQADEIRFYNQSDELVAIQVMPVIRAEREESKKRGKYTNIKRSTYTDEEIAQIDAELEAELPRGATPRYWEETEVGEQTAPVVKGPLTLPDMVTWLQAIGSPHVRSGKYWQQYRKSSPKVAVKDPETGIPQAVERVHWDNFMAAEIGMPAAYDYGSQRGGYATYFATNWVGDDGWVAELDFQYRGMFFNGDVFRINGKVVDKWRGAKTGIGYVKVEFHTINNRGDDIMPGTGIMALPSRESGPIEFPVDVREDGRAD